MLFSLHLQAERHALRQDVTRAKGQLGEAQAARLAAQAAAHTNTEASTATEQAILIARSAILAIIIAGTSLHL